MAYVPIPKDLKKVKTKVAFNLTKRQLIGFCAAGLVGFPTYFLCKQSLPNDVAVILMVCVTLPFFFMTFYEKDGMPFEKYAKYIYQHKVYQSHERRKEVSLEKTETTRTKTRTTKERVSTTETRAKKRQ
ncbi:MAG: PrgI family protein [Tissierellia bacterium]|nr:PrgI family protein [Tissierellia bacterium]